MPMQLVLWNLQVYGERLVHAVAISHLSSLGSVNVAVQFVVDVEVAHIFERVTACRAPETLCMKILVINAAKDANDEASTLGTSVLSGHWVLGADRLGGSDGCLHVLQHRVGREADARLWRMSSVWRISLNRSRRCSCKILPVAID